MPTITVITPVYKVEAYLDRCVESILAQTFTDFELILVDDGSPDNCPQMCDEWSKKDNRIRVIHQENQGQAIARNNALDVAKGEYISFVDSDDYVHPQFFEILYKNITTSGADVCICRYVEVYETVAYNQIYMSKTHDFAGAEYVTKSLLGEVKCGIWLLWDKLYRKDCFDNIRLPVGRIYEDNATVYKILYEAKKIVVCDDIIYYYYQNENSTVHQAFTKKHLDLLSVSKGMIEYFTQKEDSVLVNESNKMYLSALEDMLKKVRLHLNDKATEKDLRKRLIQQYKSEKKKYPITIKTNPSLFETMYPRRMKLYWTYKGILNKFKR